MNARPPLLLRRFPCWTLATLSLFAAATAGHAQAVAPAAPAQTPTPNPPTSQGSDTQTRPDRSGTRPDAEALKFKQLDTLTMKGWITPVPTFEDTIGQDIGGWRSRLADAGFGFTILSLNLFSYDVARAASGRSGPPLYNGQHANAQLGYHTAALTYDLGRIGLDGGQIETLGVWNTDGYQARNGPRGFRLKAFYWYQPVANGKVELELGLLTNNTDFEGTSIGGSLAGGTLGPQASIPVEVGQTYQQFSAPTISAKINWSKRLYTRTAVQRSLSPGGAAGEVADNPSGLDFTVSHARPLIIQEFGYRIAAAAGRRALWVRAGGLYNFSGYTSFRDGSRHHNHALYMLVDKQITQPDPMHPARGLYVGATYNTAPGEYDLISRYYEGRTYFEGPFAGRPNDLVSFVMTVNHYGAPGRAASAIPSFTPYRNTQAYTASYSYRLRPGLYLQPGFSIVQHPVFNQDIGTVVNALFGVNAFF